MKNNIQATKFNSQTFESNCVKRFLNSPLFYSVGAEQCFWVSCFAMKTMLPDKVRTISIMRTNNCYYKKVKHTFIKY